MGPGSAGLPGPLKRKDCADHWCNDQCILHMMRYYLNGTGPDRRARPVCRDRSRERTVPIIDININIF